jgi:hypothetical protein
MTMSLQERLRDAREEARVSLYLGASLYCDGTSFPVRIRNISSSGVLLETSKPTAVGALVQLVRGSLIVHGLVAWSDDSRCGLKFSGIIDVEQWRAPTGHGEQHRVDEIVRLVKAGAIPLSASAPGQELASGGTNEKLSAELQLVAELLEKLGDRLAKDGIVVALYGDELQNLDIAMQVVAAVQAILSGESDYAAEGARIASLRNSADQALSRAAP